MKMQRKDMLQPIFKPFCPKCEEELKGENSYVLPYRCSCGRWEWNGRDYDIIKI
jgi:hypothetical protein